MNKTPKITVDTPIGPMNILACSGNTVRVESTETQSWDINTVAYHGYGFFQKIHGKWGVQASYMPTLNRSNHDWGMGPPKDPSPAAKRKAAEAMIAAIEKNVTEELLNAGEVRDIEITLMHDEKKVEDCKKALAEAEDKLRATRARLDAALKA